MNIYQWYKEVKKSATSIKWDQSWSSEAAYLEKRASIRKRQPQYGLYDSIAQYKCQVFQESFFSVLLLQTVSFFSLLYIVIKAMANKVHKEVACNIAYFYSLSIFSTEQQKHHSFGFVGKKDMKLTGSDIFWLLQNLVRSSFNFTVISTTAFRIGQIRWAIETFSVSEIWSNMEYSPSCGLVYEYCQSKGLKLKNFMHGEKVLTIKDAFTRFDEFYVWDKHYQDIFVKLHCHAPIFISNPWKTDNPKRSQIKSNKICYILNGIETSDELKRVDEFLNKMETKGYQIFYKKHPRQPNNALLNNRFFEYHGFKDNQIQDLYEFDYIVSQYSTILLQCYFNSQEIILDDYANPDKMQALKDRAYFFYTLKDAEAIQTISKFI